MGSAVRDAVCVGEAQLRLLPAALGRGDVALLGNVGEALDACGELDPAVAMAAQRLWLWLAVRDARIGHRPLAALADESDAALHCAFECDAARLLALRAHSAHAERRLADALAAADAALARVPARTDVRSSGDLPLHVSLIRVSMGGGSCTSLWARCTFWRARRCSRRGGRPRRVRVFKRYVDARIARQRQRQL